MQLSARILTALAVLAFVVTIVVGNSSETQEVSAATGTIDALNVGTCSTNNADVFSLANDCTQKDAFFQQNPLEAIIEVETVYATYAHDPITGDEGPRAIITDGDKLIISVTDKGRDRRDPVLIVADNDVEGTGAGDPDPILKADPSASPPTTLDRLRADDNVNARKIIGDALGLPAGDDTGHKSYPDLPQIEQQIEFDSAAVTETKFKSSGTYEIVFERETGELDDFKPVARAEDNGKVKFFGKVQVGTTPGAFMDLKDYVSLDEDVISGGPDTPPAMTLRIDVPSVATSEVQLQVIYYETSGMEYMQGGDKCFADPDATPDDTNTDADEMARAMKQAACTSDEIKDGASFVLNAESDVDAGEDKRELVLHETGRFTGVFQGELEVTDPDGDGRGTGTTRENWGLMKKSGVYTEARGTAVESTDYPVIGTYNGPITINYKDTDGKNKSLVIDIDIEPPTINVASPTHKSRSDDEKPSFIGTVSDAGSGLVSDSFQLDVDNRHNDKGDDSPIVSVASGVSDSGKVVDQGDYTGFATATDGKFGVIAAVTGGTPAGTAIGGVYKKASNKHVFEDDPGDPSYDIYKSLESDDYNNGAPDGEFNGEIEIDFDEAEPKFEVFNHAVDFQAVVRDIAGNVGFSDSDTANPRFINALGEEKPKDRDPNGKKHNVLGVFSRHVVYIDELDPYIMKDASVTGFYGLDSDDNLIPDRSAVMVVFDNNVNGDLIDTGTFILEHDAETPIEIADVETDGKLVFLKLGEELASDATPMISIADGREVEDMAGNLLKGIESEADPFKLKDGILPVFTVTLSGGSGTGLSHESPSMLTSKNMDISIDSDENINGAPRVIALCSNAQWTEPDPDDATKTVTKKVSDFVKARTGTSAAPSDRDDMTCGDMEKPDVFKSASSLSRPGNNWVYAWRNQSEEAKNAHLPDGKITVVVWGRDSSKYDHHSKTTGATGSKTPVENENWGSETIEFTLDSLFNSPLNQDGSGGSVQPENDSKVKEPRPFVYLDFAGETTTVDVIKLLVDGEDVLADLEDVGDNRFLYWPEALAYGNHTVEFDARDAADNKPTGKTKFEFDVTARDPFVLDLSAGWNAISFPANPVDTKLEAVFTDAAVDRVVGWNPLSSTGQWSIATRTDGVWSTSANFAPLTEVVVRYGYWVHSAAFVKQSVALEGPLNRDTGSNPDPIGIITIPGWNFVGVVDQDGDQTEGHFGKVLQDSEDVDVTAKSYMPGFVQAYRWDGIANGYRAIAEDDKILIGDGIWVFFPDGDNIAP